MALSFVPQSQPLPLTTGAPRAARAAGLVLLEGGRSDSALRRRRMFLQRRCLVAVVAIVLALVAAQVLSGQATPAVGSGASSVPASYDVALGDSLWSIAGTLDLDADRRAVVAALADANGGTVVRPGQRLIIPRDLPGLGG